MSNFDFLKDEYHELAKLAQLAEKYHTFDPASSINKLRTLGEYIVRYIYFKYFKINISYRIEL